MNISTVLALDAAFDEAMAVHQHDGWCDREQLAAEQRRFNAGGAPYVRVSAEPLPSLLAHLGRYYNDDQLRHDLDSVLSLCATAAELRRYARARLAGQPSAGQAVPGRQPCEACGKPFIAKRSTARYCSHACRQRVADRARTKARSDAKDA